MNLVIKLDGSLVPALGAFATLIVGCMAFWIGLQQHLTAARKFQLEINAERRPIYIAAHRVVTGVFRSPKDFEEFRQAFEEVLPMAPFFFDERLSDTLQELSRKAFQLSQARSDRDHPDTTLLEKRDATLRGDQLVQDIWAFRPSLVDAFRPFLQINEERFAAATPRIRTGTP